MIMYDYCGEFYHMECIDINKEEAEGIKMFICHIRSDGHCNSSLYDEGKNDKLKLS